MSGFFRTPGLGLRLGRLLAALALLLLIGLGLYAAGRHAWADYHFRAAGAAVERGKLDEAEPHLDACLLVWPEHPESHFLKARLARRTANYAEAERRLEQCKRYRVAPEALALERSLLRAQQGELTAELETSLASLVDQGHPDAALILEALSRGFMQTYRLPRSRQCLDRWLDLRPNDVQALLGRGWVLERQSQYEKARDDYVRATQVDPGCDPARLRLAQIQLYLGQPDEALPLFEDLWRRRPQDPVAGLGVAQSLVKLGRTDEAQRLLERLTDAFPRAAPVLFERGNLALHQGQDAEAETWLGKAVALAPYDYQINYSLFQVLRRQGKEREAEERQAQVKRLEADLLKMHELTEELQKRPYDADLRHSLGQAFLRNGERHEAMTWFKSAVRIAPKHRGAHEALATLYEESGEFALAARHRQLAQEPAAPAN